jgi:hypothetical protein
MITHEDYKMKSLYERFTDEEFETMQELKNASGLGWHDFLLVSTGAVKKRDLKKKRGE